MVSWWYHSRHSTLPYQYNNQQPTTLSHQIAPQMWGRGLRLTCVKINNNNINNILPPRLLSKYHSIHCTTVCSHGICVIAHCDLQIPGRYLSFAKGNSLRMLLQTFETIGGPDYSVQFSITYCENKTVQSVVGSVSDKPIMFSYHSYINTQPGCLQLPVNTGFGSTILR